jgi:3-oxoacyl-[acyl-carrier protein] reductase
MNRIDLAGRVAIITGGAQGIGYAIAERMLDSGAKVVLWDIDTAHLDNARQTLAGRGSVDGRRVELTDEQSIAEATAAAHAAHGRIDIRVIDVNLVAPYLTCRAVVPLMIGAGYGRIVNIASIAGKEGNPNASHYSASKAGLIALTKSLAKELATKGVLVNAVSPAAAKTAIFDQMTQAHIDFMLSKIPMARFLEVKEAAAMVAWLCSEECSFSTGAVFDLSGGRATY